MKSMPSSVTLGISGASGLPYALRLLSSLLDAGIEVHCLVSQAAQVVAVYEKEGWASSSAVDLQTYFREKSAENSLFHLYGNQDWSAPIASGSAASDAMVICPCSSGALSAIACGASNNLMERAADVSLKERRPLILVPRETPFSTIFLQNCLRLSEAGAVILPACPGFYHEPKSIDDLIDFIVARILIQLGLPQTLLKPWGK